MAKQAAIISFTSLANQTSFINGVNANFAALNAALLNTHSLDGSTPNSMTANLDMNSNRILNVPTPAFPTDVLRLQDLGSTATINLISNSIAVSSFMVPILQETTAAQVRASLGLASALTDTGISVGTQFFTLIPNSQVAGDMTTNTTNIQAAIDYAFNNNYKDIYLPKGIFYYNPPIYLDPPGNLRSNLSNPTIFNFSMHLKGAGKSSSNIEGTTLRVNDNTKVALWVGPGQSVIVSDLDIQSTITPTSRSALPNTGVGIAISGGNGGSSQTILENLFVWGWYVGISLSPNNASLGDALTVRNCHVLANYIGFTTNSVNNRIMHFIDNVFQDNTIHCESPFGAVLKVSGGNYSGTVSHNKALTIGSTSALTSFSDSSLGPLGSFTNWQFTTVLSGSNQQMTDLAFDCFVIKTVGFGLVPLRLLSYVPGTLTATLKLDPNWYVHHYFAFDPMDMLNNTDLSTQLQAATILYAAESQQIFKGSGISILDVHLENPGVVTTFLNTDSLSSGSSTARIEKLYCNYLIDQNNYNIGGDSAAIFYCQQVFPFIKAYQAGGIEVVNCDFNPVNSVTDSVIIILGQNVKCAFTRCNNIPFNVWGNAHWMHTGFFNSTAQGIPCTWSQSPFMPRGSNPRTSMAIAYGFNAAMPMPFEGFFPASYVLPSINQAAYQETINTAFAIGANNYFPLFGGTLYKVVDSLSSAQSNSNFLFRSTHRFFSYGTNLTVTWSYDGATNVVTLNDTTAMFAGLNIILNNGSGNQSYLVTGVYPSLGYITVASMNDPTVLVGTKGTTYTAGTIIQEAYSVTAITSEPTSGFVTNATVGATTAAVGDLTGSKFQTLKLTGVGAANYTTRTAAQMYGDFIYAYPGYSLMLAIQNTSGGTTTLVGGTGVTVNGTATIASNATNLYQLSFPTATTCTINFVK